MNDNFDFQGEEFNCCVYAHILKSDGRVYIGYSGNIKRRWSRKGESYKSCTHFYRAIQRYGWDAFDHIVLIDGITKSMALIFEMELIKKYDATNEKCGFNISSGGPGGCCTLSGYDSPVSKTIYQYDLDGNFLREYGSIEQAKKASGVQNICSLASSESKHIMSDYQWRYYYVPKLEPVKKFSYSEYMTQKTGIICQYDTDGNLIQKYDDIRDITTDKALLKQLQHILNLNSNQITCQGYIWAFDGESVEEKVNIYKKQQKRVYQYDMDDNLIKIWYRATQIEKESDSNYKAKTINAACSGHIKNAYGYKWKYEEEVLTGKPPVVSKTKQVVQLDSDKNVLALFKSAGEAAKYVNGKYATIKYHCNQIKKTEYLGYIWEYYDPDKHDISHLEIQ